MTNKRRRRKKKKEEYDAVREKRAKKERRITALTHTSTHDNGKTQVIRQKKGQRCCLPDVILIFVKLQIVGRLQNICCFMFLLYTLIIIKINTKFMRLSRRICIIR
jgi:hypothetical protein